jgi:hypothetical protein
LLSQNAQAPRGVPLYAVLAILLYVRLADWLRSAGHRPLMAVSCAMTCALLPLLPALSSNTLSLVEYNIKARKAAQTLELTTTNLQGLVVPPDGDEILDEVAAGWGGRDAFSRIRASQRGFELSEREYIRTLLVLANYFLDRGATSARIVILDSVNPLPFILGSPAPRGGNLFSGAGFAWRPPEETLRDADFVAIPRFPIERSTLRGGLKAYEQYFAKWFVQRYEMPYWTVLERRTSPLRE